MAVSFFGGGAGGGSLHICKDIHCSIIYFIFAVKAKKTNKPHNKQPGGGRNSCVGNRLNNGKLTL